MADDPSAGSNKVKKRPARKPELRIVLDTNQLYTGSASDLLRQEIAQLVQDCRRHQDVAFLWYIPEVVRLERRHQMLEAGRQLLPPLQRLERLLGHSLGISEEILTERVGAAIEKQLATLDLKVLPIDTSRVDWRRLIEDAAGRRPPFEPGKHEKGFRDALVAESVIQLIHDSPKSPTACRVALVTADGLLASTVETRTSEAANVRILRSLDELRDLVNTVVADVTEDFVKAIRELAELCFFVKGDENSLYYSAKVRDQVASRFGSELRSTPPRAEARKNGTWFVSPPRFSKKRGQRVHWVSTVRVAAKAIRNEAYTDYDLGSIGGTVVSGLPQNVVISPTTQPRNHALLPSSYISFGQPSKDMATLYTMAFPGGESLRGLGDLQPVSRTREVVVAEGQSVFEVFWSVTVTARRKLVNPAVDDVRHVETTWEGGPAV